MQLLPKRTGRESFAFVFIALGVAFQVASLGSTFDHEIPPRKNDGFKQALFRLWLPDDAQALRGVIVESGNGGKAFFDAPEWQEFARQHQLAMLSHFVNGAIPENHEGYENGPIYEPPFAQALQALSAASKHPEIALAPLLAFGPCEATKGGFFPWRKTTSPRIGQRVLAFAVTGWMQTGPGFAKDPVNASFRDIPGLLLIRPNTETQYAAAAKSIFAVNRKHGAPWALATQISKDSQAAPLIRTFFEAVLSQRMPSVSGAKAASAPLKPIDEGKGWLGDLQTFEIAPSISYTKQRGQAAWLPDEPSAKLLAGVRFLQIVVGDSGESSWKALEGAALSAPKSPAEFR